MSRNIAGAHIPLLHSIAVEAIEVARIHIVSAIGHINIVGERIHGDSVGLANHGISSVGDEVIAHHLFPHHSTMLYDGVSD